MNEWTFFWLSALYASSINIPVAVLPFQARDAVQQAHDHVLPATLLYSLCMSGYMLSKAVAAPLMGQLSDALGRREMLVLSLVGSAIGLELSAHCTSVNQIILARVFTGWFSAQTVIVSALAVDVSPKGKEGYLFTRMSSGWALSCVLAPVVVFFADNSPSACFHVASVFASLALVFVLLFIDNVRSPVHSRSVPRGASAAPANAAASDASVCAPSTAECTPPQSASTVFGTLKHICSDRFLLLMLLGDSLMPRQDLSALIRSFGGNAFVLSLEPCVGSMTRLVLPMIPLKLFYLLSITTDPLVVSVECIACGLIVIALPNSPTLWFFFLLVVCKGCIYTFFEPSKKALINNVCRREGSRGSVTVGAFSGWTSFFSSLSSAMSSFMGEWLASYHPKLPFVWAGGLFMVNAALLLSLPRATKPEAKTL